MKIIIFYPKPFNSYEKFSRKISRIVQNIEEFSIIYQDDPNGFITMFFKENFENINLKHTSDWTVDEVTHGIVFDDGEEFPKETEALKSYNIPLRIIKIAITRVINIKREIEYQQLKSTPAYEYIGRGSYWGNPYAMYGGGEVMERDEVIRKFKYDFDFNKFAYKDKSEVYKLAGKRLGCFCKPDACHGDVLANFLNAWDDGL